MKIKIWYQSIESPNEWKQTTIPFNKLFDGYERTTYVEQQTNDFVTKFKYNFIITILLTIDEFIYNNFRN